MCGIAGYYSPDGVFSRHDLPGLNYSLAHRGPDAQGTFADEKTGLAHRRLSILDLSPAANQPMTSHSGRYVMVYNGEVYNYQEIARELDTKLSTTSDTEVILESFERWGMKCVEKFNGMFAIAIYDKQEQTLFLVRDRVGVKPLFYFWDGKNFAFASELKALIKLDFIKKSKEIEPAAIAKYMNLGYIPHPYTVYRNIFKFPSGSCMQVGEQSIRITPYWESDKKITSTLITDYKEARHTLKELLTSSVKYRMISDVPYGTFLSGGIDSSLVTAIAQSLSPQKIKTFSIGFTEARFNESQHARKVANYLGTDHHEFTVSYKEAQDLIPQLPVIYDEPFADSSAIPTALLSQMARKHVTMTLSGDGGDELFHGYGSYTWAERLNNPMVKAFRKPAAFALSMLSNKYKRASHLFHYESEEQLPAHIFSQEQYLFSESEIRDLLREKTSSLPLETIFKTARTLSPSEQQALFDLNYYLEDDLLVKVDRATMLHSLETRVPLLDYRIVEFALNLSPSLKVKNGSKKFLLKDILFGYVPPPYFDRPKQGFAIPLSVWLRNELRYLVDEYLSTETIEKYGFVNNVRVIELKKRFFKGEHYLYNRLWLLIHLHMWLEGNC